MKTKGTKEQCLRESSFSIRAGRNQSLSPSLSCRDQSALAIKICAFFSSSVAFIVKGESDASYSLNFIT